MNAADRIERERERESRRTIPQDTPCELEEREESRTRRCKMMGFVPL